MMTKANPIDSTTRSTTIRIERGSRNSRNTRNRPRLKRWRALSAFASYQTDRFRSVDGTRSPKNRFGGTVAGLAVGGREGVRQAAEPLPEDRVDFGRVELGGDLLDAGGVRGRPNAVVQWLVGDPAAGELPFEPLVAVETELGRIRKVRAELDEEGPKSRSRM